MRICELVKGRNINYGLSFFSYRVGGFVRGEYSFCFFEGNECFCRGFRGTYFGFFFGNRGRVFDRYIFMFLGEIYCRV